MPAQNGDTILLSYGPQGTQQSGAGILLSYELAATTRRLLASTGAPWGGSMLTRTPLQAPHDALATLDPHAVAQWGLGDDLDTEDTLPWGVATTQDTERSSPWVYFGLPLQPESTGPWGVAAKRDDQRAGPWGRYERFAEPEATHPWVAAKKRDDEAVVPWLGPMVVVDLGSAVVFTPSKAADQEDKVPWAFYSRRLDPGWGIPTPPNPLPEPGVPIIVPVQRIYVVQNDTLLIRVSTMDTIPCERMSLSLDVDSWTWSFSASIKGQYLDMVEPEAGEPVELEAIINGVQFRVLAEKLGRERRFGDTTIRVTGRGKAALLDSPYAPILTFSNDTSLTAQQLANNALTFNGVPLGWDINWNLESDWSVPAGLWNHTGSHISALNRIAEAAGAFIRPDPILQEITFLERYPSMPDTWADLTTVDYTLPAALTEREGIEWMEHPPYDAVYIAGQRSGYLSYVKKLGSAGETFAQMVTEPLNTAANSVARMRGRSILAQTGRKALVSLNLPVLEALGVIEPGKFVKYVDGGTERIGIVRSTQVDVTFPNVWQSISVETHIE